MRPALAVHNLVNCVMADPVPLREGTQVVFLAAVDIRGADRPNVSLGELGMALSFAPRRDVSPAFNLVADIVCLRTA
jgi:hypothetical protein